MNRLRALATLAAFLLPLSACDKMTDSTEATASSPTVSVALSKSTIHPTDSPDNTVATVIAKAPAQGMSLSPMILDETGNVVTDKFTTEFAKMPASSDSTFSTSEWKITSKITTPVGSYTLKVIVTDKKSQTASQTASFKVVADAGSTDPVDPDPTDPTAIYTTGWAGLGTVTSEDYSSLSGSLLFDATSVRLLVHIETPSGVDVSDDFFIDFPSQVTASPFSLSRVSVKSFGAPAGNYVLVFSAWDIDGNDLTHESTFSVTSSVDEDGFVMEGPVTLGAQRSTKPSILQIQGGSPTTWSLGASNKPIDKLDLLFGQDSKGILCLMSSWAADGDGFNLGGWMVMNSTEIVDMGTEFPSSRLEVDAALEDDGSDHNPQRADVFSGHYYAVRAANEEVVVLHVESVVGSGPSAEIEVTVYY